MSIEMNEELLIDLILRNLTNDEIALKLHISLSGIKKQISFLYKKYGVDNRFDLLIAHIKRINKRKKELDSIFI
jgi:DNA-binding NarL/FixJ family response regulator